jgi:hypothetical protein
MPITDLNLYEENAALEHIKSLSFTRNAMIPKEQTKTINYIKKELESEKIKVISESFNWTKSFSILMKIAFFIILIYALLYEILLLIVELIWIILLFDLLLGIILFLGAKYMFDMTKIINIGKEYESENLIVKIPARNLKEKRPVIFFSAHTDTVSVKYSFRLIKSLYITGALMILMFLSLTFILSIWSLLSTLTITSITDLFLLFRNISFIIGILIIIDIIIILFNRKTNESIGAIDNASGVAILIELAKLLNKNPLKNIDVILLWCSAEEWGLLGSRHFLNDHFESFNQTYDLDKSYNINIDMVGSYIGLVYKTGLLKKKPMNENLNDVLVAEAKQQKIPLTKASIPIGAGSDHLSFKSFTKKAEKNLQVACLCATKDTKYIHSTNDTPELCSTKNLNGCIDMCFNTINSLDLRIE